MDANWNRMFTAGIERIQGVKTVIDGKLYSCGSTMTGLDTTLWAISDILDIAEAITEAEKAAQAIGYEWSEDADEDVYS